VLKNSRGEDDPMGMLRAARAFEIAHNYNSVLKVAVDDAINTKRVRGGSELLAHLKLDELAATADPKGKDWNIKIRPPIDCTGNSGAQKDPNCEIEKDFGGVVLQGRDGSIVSRIKDDENMTRNVRDALERESRIFVVRTLGEGSFGANSADTSFQVKLRLVPVDVEFNDDGKTVKKVAGERTDPLAMDFARSNSHLNGGDYIMLELQNVGTVDAYVTVLDLQPDGVIKPAFPYPGIPHENLIKHGATYRVPYPYVFRLTEPYGQESFRLIATREPTDFSPLLDPASLEKVGRGEGNEKGGNALKSPLGKMLVNAQKGKRGDFVGVPSMWATDSVTFTVLAPKKN
ncbi:MAG TPA: DUF4384 domain-containing protein, partial [Pyrinomonadaceae bacterium]|nr:DUF4384 domain-containing protein [Pyrinomonadaceae bacterium]